MEASSARRRPQARQLFSAESETGGDPRTGKRVLLGWAGSWCFPGALPFSSCLPPELCVRLCLSGLGAAGSALFFRVLFVTGADPRTELLSGIPMIYVVSTVPFLSSPSASNLFGSDNVLPALPVPDD